MSIYKSGYEDDVDEQACFQQPDPDCLELPPNTWRDYHNAASNVAAQARLDGFERQIEAANGRGVLPDRPKNNEQRRAEYRAATKARLMTAVEVQSEVTERQRPKKHSVAAAAPRRTLEAGDDEREDYVRRGAQTIIATKAAEDAIGDHNRRVWTVFMIPQFL